jgi:tetratricopeptide (TPR) repeat protein
MPSDASHQQIGKSVGAKLREARLAKKYTQSQLAGPDFSVSYISAIERGQIHPSLRALEIFAGRLGLSSKDLLASQPQKGKNGVSGFESLTGEIEETEWQLLQAQVALRQGLYEQAIEQLGELLAEDLSVKQLIFIRYVLGQAYIGADRLQEAENVLSEAVLLARDGNNPLYPRILHLLGEVHTLMHHYVQGQEYHRHCLELLKQQQSEDNLFLARVHFGLGKDADALEKYDEALDLFAQSLSCFDNLTDALCVESYWNAGQQFSQIADFPLAVFYNNKCLHLLNTQNAQSRRSEVYHYLGRILLEKNQEEARHFLENALSLPVNQQDSLTLASLHAHLGELFLSNSNLDEAHSHIEQAHNLLPPGSGSLVAADALILRGQMAYTQQQYADGDRFFEEGLAILERLGANEELSERQVFYAQRLEERGDVLKAINYLKKAVESRRNAEKRPPQ